MSIMGGTCSMQRELRSSRNDRSGTAQGRQDGRITGSRDGSGRIKNRQRVRYSVVTEVLDENISALYPVQDNYVMNGNTRSPKTLQELCVDTLCRSLPYLDGELPVGLPQDVAVDIYKSLTRHSALNATTLRILKNCEVGSLCLAGCRGVDDYWMEQLCQTTTTTPSTAATATAAVTKPPAVTDGTTTSSLEAPQTPVPHYSTNNDCLETFQTPKQDDCAASTESFVSAPSSPIPDSALDHEMTDIMAMTPNDNDNNNNDTKPPACSFISHQEQPDFLMHSSTAPRCMPPPPPFQSTLKHLDLSGSQGLTDRGLMKLNNLEALQVATFDGCHSIIGRGLLCLASSHSLHTLSLAHCRRLNDEAIINISHLSRLEALVLDGCRCLTDRALVAISNLDGLVKLDLSQCDLITNQGMQYLDPLVQLQELSLGWCRLITNEGIDVLTRQSGRSTMLRVLRLARCPITDDGLSHLGRLSALQELDLNGCASIDSFALGNTLARLPRLQVLDASYCPDILQTSWQGKIGNLKTLELAYAGVQDRHIGKLRSLPALEELNLDSCPVGDWAIAHLAENNVVPNLKSLDLADSDLSDAGLAHLKMFTKLTRLSLFYCNITNAGLKHISKMTTLEILNLDSRDISDDGLAHLRQLSNLKSLDIFSGRITDVGCHHLAKIKSLETLELCGGGIGDMGCNLLATLDNLTSLNLSQNEKITNRGAAALATLGNLKALNLSNTRVNAEAMKFLSGLVKLQSLALYGCRGIESSSGDVHDTLHNGLPGLKCLRLNNTTEEDGTLTGQAPNLDDNDDDDIHSATEDVLFPTAASRRQTYMNDDDSDDDSQMDE